MDAYLLRLLREKCATYKNGSTDVAWRPLIASDKDRKKIAKSTTAFLPGQKLRVSRYPRGSRSFLHRQSECGLAIVQRPEDANESLRQDVQSGCRCKGRVVLNTPLKDLPML